MIEQTSLAELQKALDLFIKEYNDYLDLTEKILPGQSEETQEFVVSMIESLRIDNLNLNRLVELFSVFAASQNEKEQALRKLIEDAEKIWNNGGLIEVWKTDFDEWKEKVLKEAFVGSKP